MQSRPADLGDEELAKAVEAGWGVVTATAAYLPVGYGSHHWDVRDEAGARWFLSLDVLAPDDPGAAYRELGGALELAAHARESGCDFVVAPVRGRDGTLLRRVGEGYGVALYPYLPGEAGGFEDRLGRDDSRAAVAMLAALHAVAPPAAGVRVDTLQVPGREHLTAAVNRLGAAASWSGAYGDRLHEAIDRHVDDLTALLRRHDELVEAAGPQEQRQVLTHGEMHGGNLLRSADGLRLVDWDTALVAPPERDVWMLDVRTDGRASADYQASTGRELEPLLLDRYRLAWFLADLAVYLDFLGRSFEETADTLWSWEAFDATLRHLPRLRAELGSRR